MRVRSWRRVRVVPSPSWPGPGVAVATYQARRDERRGSRPREPESMSDEFHKTPSWNPQVPEKTVNVNANISRRQNFDTSMIG